MYKTITLISLSPTTVCNKLFLGWCWHTQIVILSSLVGVGQCFVWHVWVLLWILNFIKRQSNISIIGANLTIIQATAEATEQGYDFVFYALLENWSCDLPPVIPSAAISYVPWLCFCFNNFLSFFYICDGSWTLTTATAMSWQDCALILFLRHFFVIL